MLQENMKDKEQRIHPTQKPVMLYSWLLSKYAKSGDKILDTHVGSASSLIACHRAGLEYWGFEIDTIYYKAAKERLDRETAQVNIMDLMRGSTWRSRPRNASADGPRGRRNRNRPAVS